ncbi:MAG: tetratricopeptide repeat protein [Bacteriovoracaceae bacterium]|nr:tetratricopeptide repeat protein [Bacteriovoracaceae bacterium]
MRNLFLLFSIVFLLAGCSTTDKLTSKQKKASIYYSHGTKMLMGQQYTDALKYLSTAFKLDPENSMIANNLGMAYFFKKQTTTAINFMLLSLRLNPQNSDARNNLASIYYKNKNYDKALEQYQLIQKDLIYPHQYRTMANIGLIYLAKGMNLAAVEHFKLSTRENPDYCPAHYNLGIMSVKRHNYNGAVQNFKNGIMGSCYEQPATHYQLALAYIKLRKYILADEKLIEIQEKFPKSQYAVLASTRSIEVASHAKRAKSLDEVALLKEKYIKLQEKEDSEGDKSYVSPSF